VVPEHELRHTTDDAAERSEVTANQGTLTPRRWRRDLRDAGIVAGYGDAEASTASTYAPTAVTALLGANGAGKSTLCSVAAAWSTSPRQGLLEGKEITDAESFRRVRRLLPSLKPGDLPASPSRRT
jgi:ABC-type transport system involved in cytochrome bd biosynthesis fused ATPase/permease subunit